MTQVQYLYRSIYQHTDFCIYILHTNGMGKYIEYAKGRCFLLRKESQRIFIKVFLCNNLKMNLIKGKNVVKQKLIKKSTNFVFFFIFFYLFLVIYEVQLMKLH